MKGAFARARGRLQGQEAFAGAQGAFVRARGVCREQAAFARAWGIVFGAFAGARGRVALFFGAFAGASSVRRGQEPRV